jgi:hypothetical protein
MDVSLWGIRENYFLPNKEGKTMKIFPKVKEHIVEFMNQLL